MVNTTAPLLSSWINMDQVFDRIVSDALRAPRGQGARENGTMSQPMPVDLYTNDDQAVLIAALPGVRASDLNLSIHENTVTISGKVFDTAKSEEAKGATWYVRELWGGQFQRSVSLPFPVNPDKVEADYEDGILRVTFSKSEQAKPKRITVRTGETQSEAIGEQSDSTS